jgi:hypothetical protein
MSQKLSLQNQEYIIDPSLGFTTKLWDGMRLVSDRAKKAEAFV